MKTFVQKLAALATAPLMALAVTGAAQAHAELKTSTPAAKATVASPANLTLNFTESLTPKFSSATLTMADGSAVAAKSTASGKTVTTTPAAALTPGAYKVMWAVVASDGHKSSGNYSFTVK